MYALLLWSIPMGLIAAVRPDMARAIAEGMNAYLAGIPEPLYALFGTGYLGYTAARQWGKAKGIDRSEEHTSELQSLMRISYAVFCLKKKNTENDVTHTDQCTLHRKLH